MHRPARRQLLNPGTVPPGGGMICPGAETLLDFVDGRLGGDEALAFEEHLDTCGSCRELVACAARKDGPPSAGSTRPVEGAATPPMGDLDHYRLEGVLSQG